MRKYFKTLGQKGQTAIEYILLLMVIATMITTLAKRINEYFTLPDGETCEENPNSLVCQFQKGLGDDFRFFTLRK